MMNNYKIGDRVQIGADLCTIKYSGEIDKWPGSITYGLEWDNPTRGKHSGSYNGHQLFHTSVAGSGSFIKRTVLLKKSVPNKTMWEALQEVYGTSNESISEDNTDITFNKKHVESFGFQRLNNMNSDYWKLKIISLNKKNISKISDPNIDGKVTLDVKCLDLGFNCFSDISELTKFAECCPDLQELNLSGNRFSINNYDHSKIVTVTQVKKLFIASCNIGKDSLSLVLKLFPNLEFLDLSLNRLTDDDITDMPFPKNLKELILSDNKFKNVPTNKSLLRLQYLDLSFNLIELPLKSYNIFKTLLTLDISNNKISSWAVIDQINIIFPVLNTIKINKNPIVGSLEEQDRDDDTTYYQVIARLGKIKHIDGLFISGELRETAESYFMFNIYKKNYVMGTNLERWDYLSVHYQNQPKPRLISSSNTFLSDSILRLNIRDVTGSQNFTVYMLDIRSVRVLKGKIASLTHSCILSIKLYLSDSLNGKQYLDKDFVRIKDYYITSGCDIYYEQI